MPEPTPPSPAPTPPPTPDPGPSPGPDRGPGHCPDPSPARFPRSSAPTGDVRAARVGHIQFLNCLPIYWGLVRVGRAARRRADQGHAGSAQRHARSAAISTSARSRCSSTCATPRNCCCCRISRWGPTGRCSRSTSSRRFRSPCWTAGRVALGSTSRTSVLLARMWLAEVHGVTPTTSSALRISRPCCSRPMRRSSSVTLRCARPMTPPGRVSTCTIWARSGASGRGCPWCSRCGPCAARTPWRTRAWSRTSTPPSSAAATRRSRTSTPWPTKRRAGRYSTPGRWLPTSGRWTSGSVSASWPGCPSSPAGRQWSGRSLGRHAGLRRGVTPVSA